MTGIICQNMQDLKNIKRNESLIGVRGGIKLSPESLDGQLCLQDGQLFMVIQAEKPVDIDMAPLQKLMRLFGEQLPADIDFKAQIIGRRIVEFIRC